MKSRDEKRLKTLGKLAALAAGGAAVSLAAAYGCYRYIFYAHDRDGETDDMPNMDPLETQEQYDHCVRMIEKLNAREYERVEIRSFDGLRLVGRYYRTDDSAPLAIMFHGYTGTPSRDFCGGADICLSMGYNVLIIEERAHCGSDGNTISFGINERKDVISWLDYAVSRFGKDKEIILVGISMGASTVLMSVELGLPANVKGIIADCPYSSPDEIIRHVGELWQLPIGLMMPFVKLGARIFGGFDLYESSPEWSVRSARIPVMIIHGEADDFVPCIMSKKIADANPRFVERHTFPGAWHGTSYLVDTKRYEDLVKGFCEKVLGQ